METEKVPTMEVDQESMLRKEIGSEDRAIDCGDVEYMVSLQAKEVQWHSLGSVGHNSGTVGGNQRRCQGEIAVGVSRGDGKHGDVGTAVHQEILTCREVLDGESERSRR